MAGILLATYGGIVIHNVGNLLGLGDISLLMLSVPLTALSVAGLSNAYNMIDGIDGLAGSTMLRRLKNGHRLMEVDRSHLHHTLMSRGLSPRKTLLVMVAYGTVCDFLGLALERLPESLSLLLFFCFLSPTAPSSFSPTENARWTSERLTPNFWFLLTKSGCKR